MTPVLICSEYPKDDYGVGEVISFYLFVVNDLPQGLGRLHWAWELSVEENEVAQGTGEIWTSADSVVEIVRVEARLPVPGRAALRLRLYGGGVEASNAYDFSVRDGAGRGLLAERKGFPAAARAVARVLAPAANTADLPG
jgi:hypothetical protein